MEKPINKLQPLYNKYHQPINSPADKVTDAQETQVPWEWAIKQKIQSKHSRFSNVTIDGTLTVNVVSETVVFNVPVQFNGGGTFTQGTYVYQSNTGTPAVISLLNHGGTEVLRMEAGTGNFGTMTASGYVFASNTSNRFIENFGPVAKLADTAGVHSFWVQDSGGINTWQFASNGEMKQLKAGDWQLQGPIGDPGAGPADSAKLYIKTFGGKDQLCVQWSSGAIGTIISQP